MSGISWFTLVLVSVSVLVLVFALVVLVLDMGLGIYMGIALGMESVWNGNQRVAISDRHRVSVFRWM